MPYILLILGVILTIYSFSSINKKNSIHKEKESVLFKKIYSEEQESITDYKYELGILRKDIGESLNELQQEILEIKINLGMIKENELLNENKEANKLADEIYGKSSDITQLLKEGLTDEEICKKLSVTKGEILLVKSLYK